MDLIIANKMIITPMSAILRCLQSELTNGKLKDIGQQHGQNIPVTCPYHKDGKEAHPSCNVFADRNDPETMYGTVHCFSCGYKASLPQFINDCFDETGSFGEEWLLQRCETAFVSEVKFLPEIDLSSSTKKKYMDESQLERFNYYHVYTDKRKLSKEIVDLFEVGYDPLSDMITFPVRDEKGGLCFVTKRSVEGKRFEIPKDVQKPVYLLYYIIKHGIDRVAVCESQINALYSWSCGVPAIALFGTGTSYQYELLKKSGIRIFDLYFDGDFAGQKGAYRFKKAMGKDVLINHHILPAGKDINDLSKEEFLNLPCIS